MIYRVHERFTTFQGEGVHMGLPAFFIRLYGCSVHCPWCDSAGTWHKDWAPASVLRPTGEELAMEAAASGAPIVVITGGEPAMYDLAPLCHALRLAQSNVRIHIETSGAFPLRTEGLVWVTLSPKKWALPLPENVSRANEFKIICETPEDINYYLQALNTRGLTDPGVVNRPIWLHPEWSQRFNPAVLNAITIAVIAGKGYFRAGYQIHKLYQADLQDERTAPLVPLGGDPMKGY